MYKTFIKMLIGCVMLLPAWFIYADEDYEDDYDDEYEESEEEFDDVVRWAKLDLKGSTDEWTIILSE